MKNVQSGRKNNSDLSPKKPLKNHKKFISGKETTLTRRCSLDLLTGAAAAAAAVTVAVAVTVVVAVCCAVGGCTASWGTCWAGEVAPTVAPPVGMLAWTPVTIVPNNCLDGP